MRPGLLVALLAVVLLAAPVGAATSAESSLDDPTTTYTFDLQRDGDASVTVTVEYSLDTANETEAFREVGDDFERGAVGPRIDVFERAADASSESTGREMNLSEPKQTAFVENRSDNTTVGVLELSFEWSNFAMVEDSRLSVGDAYQTSDGTWLPSLRENQRLRVSGPRGYGYADGGSANIENGALVWEGPTTFEEGDRQVVLSGDEPTTPTSTNPNGSGQNPNGPVQQLFSPIGGILALLALTGLGLYTFMSRRDDDASGTTTVGDGGSMTGGAAATDGAAEDGDVSAEPAPESESEPEPEPEQQPEPAEDGPFAGVDEELLSDEERVERLLEYNGGRMKQATIVDETGWSNAKVSQLLSSMDESERVDKLRIGRENLISLPDADNGTGTNGGS